MRFFTIITKNQVNKPFKKCKYIVKTLTIFKECDILLIEKKIFNLF